MTSDVAFAERMEGGYVHGHQAARAYWTRQWSSSIRTMSQFPFIGRIPGVFDVHQVVRDLAG